MVKWFRVRVATTLSDMFNQEQGGRQGSIIRHPYYYKNW